MNILDLLQQDGCRLKRVSSTHGGEYAGPCPWCGGRDRFRVWPYEGSGRYWCRQCSRSGDSIQYMREFRKMTYREACDTLGIEPRLNLLAGHRKPLWAPRPPNPPRDLWQGRADAFLAWAQQQLWGDQGAHIRTWLNTDRGLANETIAKARLGWNPADTWCERRAWGLKNNGKKLWLPKGLVIPYKGPVRLRIRRPNPGRGPRYYLVPGSDARAMLLPGPKERFAIVESELDGLLLHQEAGDLVSVVALGSAQGRPDEQTHRVLEQAEEILVALDADGPGTKEVFWWKKHYPRAKWWPVPEGKDPTEAMQAGLSIRLWVSAGLRSCGDVPASRSPDSSVPVNSHVLDQNSAVSCRNRDPKVVCIDQPPSSRPEIDKIKNR